MDAEPKETTESTIPAELLEGAVDISTDQDGGVRKVILTEGSGEDKPGVGDEVFVHYVGTLLDGRKFDSSRDRNEQFKFKLGLGQVIKAWDQGVATMKRGELCRLICKSDYAYGKTGSPPTIPPDADLIFEVELFDWRGEDLSEGSTGGILKSTKKAGEGYISPNESSEVKVDIRGLYGDRVFDERSVSFTVGDASEAKLPEGIDVAIRKFKQGEKAILTLKPEYAFGSEGSEEYDIPGAATVTYEVTLKEMERAKEIWEMEPDEKLNQAELTKDKGTKLFKANKYSQALNKYKLVIKLLDDETDFVDDEKASRNNLTVAAHLNCALCYLKQENYSEARESCGQALQLDDKNVKGYFRRGQAWVSLKDWKNAKDDFSAVLKIDPANKAAKNQLTICEHHLKVEKEREKKLYTNMFAKGLSAPSEQVEATAADGDGSSAV